MLPFSCRSSYVPALGHAVCLGICSFPGGLMQHPHLNVSPPEHLAALQSLSPGVTFMFRERRAISPCLLSSPIANTLKLASPCSPLLLAGHAALPTKPPIPVQHQPEKGLLLTISESIKPGLKNRGQATKFHSQQTSAPLTPLLAQVPGAVACTQPCTTALGTNVSWTSGYRTFLPAHFIWCKHGPWEEIPANCNKFFLPSLP